MKDEKSSEELVMKEMKDQMEREHLEEFNREKAKIERKFELELKEAKAKELERHNKKLEELFKEMSKKPTVNEELQFDEE